MGSKVLSCRLIFLRIHSELIPKETFPFQLITFQTIQSLKRVKSIDLIFSFYPKLKGSDYLDKGSFDVKKHLSGSDLSYIDDSGATVSIIEIGDSCCKPIRIKCTKVKKNKERCNVSKGNLLNINFLLISLQKYTNRKNVVR